ncbi:MAG: hypothetical protein AMJ54_02075 [Deltaproteobacteria bacterium SG8_13]|nr:MAG: hypothetical protein AMJ54_02075 [Deltaproteobacteria bacterium SG8_13]
MNRKILAAITAAAVTLLLTAAAPCGAKDQQINELIARLYLNHNSLQTIYRDLHEAAIDNIDGSDRQLSYIQKSYLFVSEANLVCLYQWELLSMVDYIRQESRSDYFTLRVKGLRKAIFESRDRINSLMLYYGFIDTAQTRKLLDDAIGLIEANIYTYEQLVDMLTPMANPPNPSRPSIRG